MDASVRVVEQARQTAGGPPRGALDVLVIDDNPLDREITARFLGQAWPFEREVRVLYAKNGYEAIETMRRNRVALIVLDWRLPGMSGFEVLRAIRQNGVRVPVVVMSGLPREAIQEDLTALGAAFVTKDELAPATLRSAIRLSLELLGYPVPAAVS